MRVFVVTPPAPIVTWEEADQHLRLDGDEEQRPMVERLIAAATNHIDGPDGWLGRALGIQTLEARFDAYETGSGACEGFRLPYPPIVEVVDVSWLVQDRSVHHGDLQDIELIGDTLYPVTTAPWEGLLWRREALRIQYRAGYAVDPNADPVVQNVPEAIRHAVLLMVGDMYRFTETASELNTTPTAIPMSTTVENLLAPLRVYG